MKRYRKLLRQVREPILKGQVPPSFFSSYHHNQHHSRSIVVDTTITSTSTTNIVQQQQQQQQQLHVGIVPFSSLRRNNDYHKIPNIMRQQPLTTTTTISTSTSNTSTTESHYVHHQSIGSYEDAYFYEPGSHYIQYLKQLVQERLQLNHKKNNNLQTATTTTNTQRTTLLDIGGGTGTFTKLLVESLPIHPIVLDPFLETETKNVGDDNNNNDITYIKESAEVFMEPQSSTSSSNDNTSLSAGGENEISWRKNYNYVLLKEVAHHFQEKDRIAIFRGIYEGLVPTSSSVVKQSSTSSTTLTTTPVPVPSLLIITRPQKDIDYPLWDEAREVWFRNQPSIDQFQYELESAGFTNVQHSIESYPCSIPLQRWQKMIQTRFWSTFANFTDIELENACQSIAHNEKDRIVDGMIRFDDRLVFISACKTV